MLRYSLIFAVLFVSQVAGGEDTPFTTNIWRLCSTGDATGLAAMYMENKDVVSARPADGRGALFWAYEFNQPRMVNLLLNAGADEDMEDNDGKKPRDFAPPEFKMQRSEETFEDIAPARPPPIEEDEEDEDDETGFDEEEDDEEEL